MCSSPWLIAAYHVLRRLLMPRHSPCALHSLTSFLSLKPLSGSQNYASSHKKVLLAKLYLTQFCSLLLLIFSSFIFHVQFSRSNLSVSSIRSSKPLTSKLLSSTDAHPFRMLFPSPSGHKNGGPKWTRTTDLTIISRAL